MACKNIIARSQELLGCEPEEVGVAWVAMRTNLLHQAKTENDAMVQCPNVVYVSMFDSNPMPKLAGYKKVIMAFDEVHHSACATGTSLYSQIKPDLIIGLSATPVRTDKMDLCFQVTLTEAGYHRLIQDGFLSKFDHYMLDQPFTPEEVAAVYLENPDQWGKSVMFFLTEEECRRCAELLRRGGVRCEVVTGKTDRETQLAAYAAGEVDVLINIVILTEGFDSPETKTVWVRDAQSRSVVTQMAGRALRLHPDLPIKQIVQSQHSKYPFTRVAGAHRQLVRTPEETWVAVGNSEQVEQMVETVLAEILNREVPKLPKFLQGNPKALTWENGQLKKTNRKAARNENADADTGDED
jgi:superfamily II DNA or RNA helicase